MSGPLEYLLPIEVKRVVGAGEIDGYASTFGNVDLAGDIVAPGAFAKTLREHRDAGSQPAMLWGHDPTAPVGVWTDAKEDRIGLRTKGRLTLDTVRGAEARALAIDGALGLSIGFRARDSGFEKGRRVLKDVQLFEVSLVAIPANPQAKLVSVKSAVESGELTPRTIERLLCDGGVPARLAKKIISSGWRASAGSDDGRHRSFDHPRRLRLPVGGSPRRLRQSRHRRAQRQIVPGDHRFGGRINDRRRRARARLYPISDSRGVGCACVRYAA